MTRTPRFIQAATIAQMDALALMAGLRPYSDLLAEVTPVDLRKHPEVAFLDDARDARERRLRTGEGRL